MQPPSSTAAQPSPRRFRTVRNLRLLGVLAFFHEFNPTIVIWVVYLTDFRDISLAQVGIMEGFFWGVKLLLEVPSGAFADRYGRRITAMVGVAVEGAGIIAFGLADSYLLLLGSYVLWSGGLAFKSGNDEAYLFDTLAVDDRQVEFAQRHGAYRGLGHVAFAISGVLGGVIAAATTLQIAVLVSGLTYVAAFTVLIAMQEPPRRCADGAPIEGGLAPRASYLRTIRVALDALRADAALRWILVLQVVIFTTFPVHFVLSQPFLSEHDVPLALFGVVDVPARMLGAAGLVLSARFGRRVGLGRALWMACALSVIGLIVLAGIDHVGAFAGFILLQVGGGLALPLISAYANDRTDSSIRATILSVAPLGSSLTYTVVTPILGIVGDWSLQLAFGVMGVGIGGSALLAYTAWARADREHRARLAGA